MNKECENCICNCDKSCISEIQEKAYQQGRADAITECLQIVQKIKDDYNEARFGEQIPINYGTLCGIIIAFEKLKEQKNDNKS